MAADTDRLAEIETRIPALYKGPWSVSWADGDGENTPDRWVVSYPTDNPLAGLVAEVADYGAELADFIAHARTDMPWLVTELRTARAELAIREEQVAGIDQRYGAVHEALTLWRTGDIDTDDAMQRIHDALGTPAIPGKAA